MNDRRIIETIKEIADAVYDRRMEYCALRNDTRDPKEWIDWDQRAEGLRQALEIIETWGKKKKIKS